MSVTDVLPRMPEWHFGSDIFDAWLWSAVGGKNTSQIFGKLFSYQEEKESYRIFEILAFVEP